MSDVNVTATTEDTNEIPTKGIFNLGIARALLRQGYRIVDIKPRRDNPEAFLPFFEDSLQFRNAWSAIVRDRKRNRVSKSLAKEEEVKEPLMQED